MQSFRNIIHVADIFNLHNKLICVGSWLPCVQVFRSVVTPYLLLFVGLDGRECQGQAPSRCGLITQNYSMPRGGRAKITRTVFDKAPKK